MDLPLADSLIYGVTRYCASRDPVRPIEAGLRPSARRILAVVTTGLGDAVLSTPVLPALRASYPDAQIRVMVRRQWAPLFEADPDVDGVIAYHGKYRRFVETIRQLREFSPDLAIVLHGNDPDILPLCYLAGARRIVRIPTRGTRYGFLLSNAARPEDAGLIDGWHYIENRLRVLSTLGVPAVSVVPRIALNSDMVRRVRERFVGLLDPGGYWVLHPVAADPYKAWPERRARALIERLPGMRVVVSGGTADAERLRTLSSGVPHAMVIAGDLDIGGFAALLAGARCVVAPDTGILHLAAALDRPTVGLYAPTSARLVGARSPKARAVVVQKPQTCTPCVEKRCPYVPQNCMDQIAEEDVLAAVRQALSTPV